MFYDLFLSTLPLFALVFTGYISGKFSVFNQSEAKVLLKLIGAIVLPALGIKIIGSFRYEFINWHLYVFYLTGQILIYFCGFLIAAKLFKRNHSESIIIGMTSSFSNHVFFVYPIALFEFGPRDIVPIETIIAADFVTVGLSICALDIVATKKIRTKNILLKQIKNPAVIGLSLGLLVFATSTNVPLSIQRLVDLICDSGTPCALIAMGILLSFKTDKTQIKLSIVITSLKILAFPVALYLMLIFADYNLNIAKTTLMVSAAPIGAMGLIFASLYNVTTDAVVRAGVFTYLLALISIPIVGSLP
ncbi:MAG: hypothetical protein CFH06_01481 [Alphaproteobacteria bacterium MarineAlpha3_Bin5]|nr:MAG: hypothetical protein CFH06_01481 [Alphaproteobacteria bacterium MarineAlpha3_Bin5]